MPPSASCSHELWSTRAALPKRSAAGDHGARVQSWRVVSSARPDDWRASANYGDALAASDRWADAAAAFRRAVDLNPDEPELRRKLAAALARSGHYDEGANELERWIDSAPDNIGVRVMFARFLSDLGRDRDMRAQLDKAAQLARFASFEESPDALMALAGGGPSGSLDVGLLRELAHLLERTNRIDVLRALLDRAEAAGIARTEFGYSAAAIALRNGDAVEAKRLLSGASADDEPVRRHWLAARIEEALDDPAAAFAEAETMNRLANDYATWRARGDAYLHFVRELAATITPQWAARLKTASADPESSPIFVVGFPRSGTTLLDTFLMGHPDLEVLEEAPLMRFART